MNPGTQITNPFPGLRPFEPDQADFFFGRDEQIEALLERLHQRRFLAVVGTSGSGKSSLVRAGLIPNLQQGYLEGIRWRIAVLRPGNDPLAELARSLSRAFEPMTQESALATLQRSSLGLVEFSRQSLADDEHLLVVVDQFEELFRYRKEPGGRGGSEKSAAFVKLLLTATGHSELPLPDGSDAPIYVVLTMRSDFLGKCSQFPGLPEALNDSQYLVPRLTREQQREAIEGPIELAGARITPLLVQRLLNDITEDFDQLPVLQQALMRIWETWDGKEGGSAKARSIDVDDYNDIGGTRGAVDRDAELVLKALQEDDPENETIVRRIFQRLAEPGEEDRETRRPTPLSEILAIVGVPQSEALKAKVLRVTEAFRSRGFLSLSQDPDPIVDITHESLIRLWDTLRKWVEAEARSARIYSRLATSRSLYREAELTEALAWRDQEKPNAAWARRYPPKGDSSFSNAMRILDRSRKEEERRKNIRRFSVLALIVALAGFVGLAAWASRQSRIAVAERLRADADALARGPGRLHQQGLLLAMEALNRLQSAENDNTLRRLLATSPVLVARKSHRGAVTALQFSPNGKLLLSGSEDQTVRVWEAATGKEWAVLQNPDKVLSASFDKTGKYIAVACGNLKAKKAKGSSPTGRLLAWEWNTPKDGHILVDLPFSKPVQAIAFREGDQKLLATDGDLLKTVSLGEPAQARQTSLDKVDTISLDSKGSYFAAVKEKGLIKIVDANTLRDIKNINSYAIFPSGPPGPINFSCLGEKFLCVKFDKDIYFFDAATGEEIFSEIAGSIADQIAFSPDKKNAALLDSEELVTRDVATGQNLWSLKLDPPEDGSVGMQLLYSPNGKSIAVSAGNRVVSIYDTASHQMRFQITADRQVSNIAFSPDGTYFAVGEADGTLTIWQLAGGSEHEYRELYMSDHHLDPQTNHVVAVNSSTTDVLDDYGRLLARAPGVSQDKFAFGERYFAYSVKEGGIAKINIKSLHDKSDLAPIVLTSDVKSIGFLRPGCVLCVATADGLISRWNLSLDKVKAAGKFPIVNKGKNNLAASVFTFSPNAKNLLVRLGASEYQLWDVEAGALRGKIKADLPKDAIFSPDGSLIAAPGNSGIAVWTTSGSLHKLWDSHRWVSEFSFSPDGRFLVTSNGGGELLIWGATGGDLKQTLSREADIENFSFSPDSKYLAVSYNDSSVYIWRLEDGASLADIDFDPDHDFEISDIVFSPDGRLLTIIYSLPGVSYTEKTVFRTVWWHSEDLIQEACRHLSRNLNRSEWSKYLPGESYPGKSSQKTCSNLP